MLRQPFAQSDAWPAQILTDLQHSAPLIRQLEGFPRRDAERVEVDIEQDRLLGAAVPDRRVFLAGDDPPRDLWIGLGRDPEA